MSHLPLVKIGEENKMAAPFTSMHYNNTQYADGRPAAGEEAAVRTVYSQELLCMAHCCSVAEPMAATE